MRTDALTYLKEKLGVEWEGRRNPVEIPNVDRNWLAGFFREIGCQEVVELGVEQGEYSEVLCKANPEGHLICIDPWQHYKGYRDHVNQQKLDGFYEKTKARLAPYTVTFIKDFSETAVKQFKDESLDAIYIDANHSFQYVVNDLCWWVPKIKKGGIVSGHDYCKTKNDFHLHVMEAVHGYTSAFRVSPWFVLGKKEKEEGVVREKRRSFMWVKQ
jgi:hypothetical protein